MPQKEKQGGFPGELPGDILPLLWEELHYYEGDGQTLVEHLKYMLSPDTLDRLEAIKAGSNPMNWETHLRKRHIDSFTNTGLLEQNSHWHKRLDLSLETQKEYEEWYSQHPPGASTDPEIAKEEWIREYSLRMSISEEVSECIVADNPLSEVVLDVRDRIMRLSKEIRDSLPKEISLVTDKARLKLLVKAMIAGGILNVPHFSWVTEEFLPLPLEEKWIEVDLAHQRLVAYEGIKPIYRAEIGTNLTISGKYRIEWKIERLHATRGPWGTVILSPYVMAFGERYRLQAADVVNSYSILGPDNAVSLKSDDAKWVFSWVDPESMAKPSSTNPGVIEYPLDKQGTWVLIHQ